MTDVFCDQFFPLPSEPHHPQPTINGNPFETLKDANCMLEAELTDKFVHVLNDHNLVPGLVFRYCGDRPDPAAIDGERQKPDAAFYRENLVPQRKKKDKKYQPLWGCQLFGAEFKRRELDPFQDTDAGDVQPADSGARTEARGQVLTYGELLLAVQQRVSIFILLVIGRRCRFIRFDRSGSIVTRLLDYYEHYELFCEILWRISQCSDEQLGCDPSAVRLLPGDPDYAAMDEAAIPRDTDVDHEERILKAGEVPGGDFVFKYVREKFRNSLVELWPRYRLQVPDGEATREFLVCKPAFCAKGLAGRGTRGYVALDCKMKRFVWLKDAWRAYYLMVEKEGDVLNELNKKGVPYVPTLICHGDILDQDTFTPTWWEKHHPAPPSASSRPLPGPSEQKTSSSLKRKRPVHDDGPKAEIGQAKDGEDGPSSSSNCPLRRHRHYRLVEKEVALPLTEFKCGRQLLKIVRDSMIAHWKATEVGILHRDVSGGNILILPMRRIPPKAGPEIIVWVGILTDWEMSKPLNGVVAFLKPRQPERTGTWQFMSVALLSSDKMVEICDEVEAFTYIIIYYAMRYLHSNVRGFAVASFLDLFYDTYDVDNDGNYVCGRTKRGTIESGELSITPTSLVLFNSPLDAVLSALLRWFKSHTFVTRYEARHKIDQPKPQPPRTPSPTPVTPEDADPFDDVSYLDPESSFGLPPPGREIVTNDAPTVEDRELAKKVVSQTEMINLLIKHIGSPEWNPNDKVGDKVPETWCMQHKLRVPIGTATVTSSKKLKKNDGLPVRATAAQSLSGCPPVTPTRRVQVDSGSMPALTTAARPFSSLPPVTPPPRRVRRGRPVPATATHSLFRPPPAIPPRRVRTSKRTSAGPGGES
ncbi:hypothetical protein C8Q74DRAFT_1344080 [Fomes fomentarius]|nr:hypothetical protein C8Q74DRAFT_1344080 [Fomes fomentarius]